MSTATTAPDTFLQSGSSPPIAPDFIIDPEFRALIAALSAEELQLLRANIESDGCLTPLIVWHEERILLDGHNRHKICTEIGNTYQVTFISLDSREAAKLWVLENQVGRRNLTDDQRSVLWNEIREARSAVEKRKRTAAATAARHVKDVKADSPRTDTPAAATIPTRTAIAKEAKLPESKLRAAQVLKKHQPALYEKVRTGEITLRDTSKLIQPKKRDFTEKDFYNRVGRSLHGLYTHNHVNEHLQELLKIKKGEWNPEAETGITRLLCNFDEIAEQTEQYKRQLKDVLKRMRGIQ